MKTIDGVDWCVFGKNGSDVTSYAITLARIYTGEMGIPPFTLTEARRPFIVTGRVTEKKNRLGECSKRIKEQAHDDYGSEMYL